MSAELEAAAQLTVAGPQVSPRGLLSSWGRLCLDALSRRRVQLIGGTIFAVLLPALVRWSVIGFLDAPTPDRLMHGDLVLRNSIPLTLVALVAGYIILQQLRAHPGARSFAFVIYPFTLCYGACVLGLLISRADYSRYQIFSSYVLAIAWFIGVDGLISRRMSWRLGYLPRLHQGELPRSSRVNWTGIADAGSDPNRLMGVVADLSANHEPSWERYMARAALAGVPVFDVRQVSEWLTGQVRLENLSQNTLSAGLSQQAYVRLKWLIDIGIIVLVGPFFALMIVAASIAIRLESRGPAIFTQTRMGHRGRPFTIYKLRTMRLASSGESYTTDGDPRITRVGAFLRKRRLDEFPQIWNIVRGEMSWIGPRPEAVDLAQWYEAEVPFYCYRHMVRPGITGWAQVNQGNVARPDAAAKKLRYDFYYIKYLSPWLDLLIIAKTVRTIATGFGSK